MRFTTARLCGGEAIMAISAEVLDIDMKKAKEHFMSKGYNIKQSDDLMMVFDWNGMETTLYPQGKVMFFPLQDKSSCIRFATEILDAVI